MGKPSHWIVILQLASSAFAYRYDPWYRGDTQRPVDVITDVVNDLGVKLLQQYSAHGNVAFSPMGVAFVLMALYEGSAGRGRQQIVDAVGLPANQDVIRIGFRDIHRRLRSYLNADGFLGGLTLSRDNVRLRPEYEDILRFYGFDLSSIEQEANVTVSAMDSTSTTELSASTFGPTTLSTETTDTEMPDTTVTTLTPSSVSTETATVPATTSSTTQQTTTTPIGDGTTLNPAASSGAAGENASTPPADASATVATGESAQPSPSADAGNQTTSSPTMTGTGGPIATPADGQTSPSTMIITVVAPGDQSPTSPTVAAGVTGTNGALTNTANTNSMSGPTTTPDVGTQGATAANTEIVPTTFGTNTTGLNSSTAATPTPPTPVAPAASGGAANTTVPSAVTEMTMDNSVVPQPNTEASTSAGIPVSGAPGMTATIDLTTSSMSNADGAAMAPAIPVGATTMTLATGVPPVQAANGAANDLAGNGSASNSTIANSAMSSALLMNNQPAASLVGENAIASSRKKKSSVTEAIGSAGRNPPRRSVMNDDTVKDESTDSGPANPPHKRRETRSPRGYFSSYPDEGVWMQDLDIWKSYSTASPDESSSAAGDTAAEISFLVNGCDVSSVSASRYIAVLPFAYFPSLHAVALEFPLDDPRYNIILLMPTDRTDTHRLARDLGGKSLRSLRKRLQPTWVRATIPSFMLRGFVTLTSFLQRLGILDVFEPRVADLSPMTADLGVYARDVQQSIGVNIRNYMKPDRTHSRNGLFERAGPVPFTALHPFLYFIVDTETSVSLIAGRVDDPLNSRVL